MHIYIYVCVHICTYTYIYKCIYIYTCIHIYDHVQIYRYVYIYIYTHVFIYVYIITNIGIFDCQPVVYDTCLATQVRTFDGKCVASGGYCVSVCGEVGGIFSTTTGTKYMCMYICMNILSITP
jgi:hypothetical protein